MLGRIFVVLATLAIFHAAFSTYEHLSHLKALGRPEGSLPADEFNMALRRKIVFEALLALVFGTIGASCNAPELKEITWASEMKKCSIDGMDSRMGFANFVSRGKSFLSQHSGDETKRS
ncbi:hypothetical protein PLICRDRAFT_177094 [Plicaturopsis crispa FD-325 SS-3]|nr:hypothetical protein PLICRDRAFT_177094 [Plicaturopsis crispa FD-325 SS-3]